MISIPQASFASGSEVTAMDNKTVYYRPLPPKPATLLLLEPNDSVRVVTLEGDMKMGRDVTGSMCDIKLRSCIASRDHGDFIFADGAYHYRDNNSLNGTFYNGVKLEQINERGSRAVRLQDGDVLRIDRRNLDEPHPDAVAAIFSTTFNADEKWNRYSLRGQSIVPIGRNITSGISLTDFMASRNHASLVLMPEGRWKIVDNGSTNGVAVNKNAITGERLLDPFDVIRIANTTLIFLEDEVIFNAVQPKPQKITENQRQVIMNVNIQRATTSGIFRKRDLLRDIRLDVESGDFILILGGSGAGKTTFINALRGRVSQSGVHASGQVLFGGMDLYKNFKMLKNKVGLVPQFPTTRDEDTVYHTVHDMATSMLAGDYTQQEIEMRIKDVFDRLMLNSLRDRFIKNLSGGQKKRAEVALGSVLDQEVFILDEPDSGMDFATRVELMKTLKSCTETGEAIAVISHAPDDAADLYTKVIVLAKSQSDEVGHLAYYGDVANAYSFFGVNKLSEIVMEINYEGGKGRADEFIRRFEMTRRG